MADPSGISLQVRNLDVAGLADRIVELAVNVLDDASSGQSETSPHAIRRMREGLARLDRYVAAVSAPVQPLDLTVSFPQPVEVLAFPEGRLGEPENRETKDIVRRLLKLWQETVGGQSKDRTSGLQVHDKRRYDELVANMRSIIDFIEGEPSGDVAETPDGVTSPELAGVIPAGR